MTNLWVLVAVLVVLAGVIAYAGDRLGTWVGRRRLTLFGARPKRTGQIVGVAAGITIMATTILVLALAFRSATETLIDAQRTAVQLDALRTQERRLSAELADLLDQQAALAAERDAAQASVDLLTERIDVSQAEVDRLEALAVARAAEAEALRIDNVGLQARNDQLTSSNDELLGRNESLTTLNRSLQEEIIAGNASVVALQARVDELSSRLEEQARRLAEAQQELAAVASGDITFARGQVVYAGALDAPDVAAARAAVAEFVRAASERAAALGAGEVVLSVEQLNALAEAIVVSDGEDYVRMISPTNQSNPARVQVEVDVQPNARLHDAGALLLTRSIHLGSADAPAAAEDVRAWVAQLRTDAIRALRRAGLDELQVPIFEGVGVDAFATALQRGAGPTVIGVTATEEIRLAGPAYVELIVVYGP